MTGESQRKPFKITAIPCLVSSQVSSVPQIYRQFTGRSTPNQSIHLPCWRSWPLGQAPGRHVMLTLCVMSEPPVTQTQLKLRDAATQMKLALANSGDIDIVRSCVNSYISHARSVTFVMQQESSAQPKLVEWYQEQQTHLKDDPLMRFFNEKRVHVIHRGVVSLRVKTAPIYNIVKNGVPLQGPGTMTVLLFDGVDECIPGSSGNVFRLCEEYFIKLKQLVGAWLAERRRYLPNA